MAKEKIYSAIDLGSQTIRAAIGRLLDDGSMEVIGYGTASSEGIIKGHIENANAAQEAVKKAVLAAENDVKARVPYRMDEVAVSVTGSSMLVSVGFSSDSAFQTVRVPRSSFRT